MTWPRSSGAELNCEPKLPNSNITSTHYDSPGFFRKGNNGHLFVSIYVFTCVL